VIAVFSSSPAQRGRKIETRSRDAMASESCKQRHESFASKYVKGGGAPTGASSSMSAPHSQALPSESAPGAVARHTPRCCHLKALRARSPLGAPLAALAAQINATAQPRPRFGRTGGCGCYPHHRTHLQRCTSRTGRCAGRSDAQAAREQFARLPAGTALAPLSGSHLESALH
jgi:hypothetical protein